MATLNGINSTKRKADPSALVDVCEQGGRMRVTYDKHTADAAQNDVLNMGWLPAGAKAYRVEVKHGAMGALVTFDIGYDGAATAFASNYDASAAGSAAFIVPTAKLTDGKDVQILIEGADPAQEDIELMTLAVITQTSICNSALIKLGAERIVSIDDDNKRARLCKEQYEKVRNDLLMSHPWNFAITRKTLAEVATYTDVFEFEKAFQIPPDALRVLSTSLNLGPQIGEVKWAVEIDPLTNNKLLLTNESAVDIKYIKDVDEAFFTPAFAELLAHKMALDLSYSITQSASLSQLLQAQFDKKIKNVRSFDASEGSLPRVESDDFLLARLTNGPGFFTMD
jgi:hypothetical protein